jgi:hypothetical protein
MRFGSFVPSDSNPPSWVCEIFRASAFIAAVGTQCDWRRLAEMVGQCDADDTRWAELVRLYTPALSTRWSSRHTLWLMPQSTRDSRNTFGGSPERKPARTDRRWDRLDCRAGASPLMLGKDRGGDVAVARGWRRSASEGEAYFKLATERRLSRALRSFTRRLR